MSKSLILAELGVRMRFGEQLWRLCSQVAGLDVGWGQQIDMDYNSDLHRYEVIRHLPPGRYAYKFIMDGHWTYSADHPTFTVSHPAQS